MLVVSADVTVWVYCQVVAAKTQRCCCSPEEPYVPIYGETSPHPSLV